MPKITTTYKVVPVTSYEVVVFEEVEHEDGGVTGSEESYGIFRTERGANIAVNALKALDQSGVSSG